MLNRIWATHADPKDTKDRSCVTWIVDRLLQEDEDSVSAYLL